MTDRLTVPVRTIDGKTVLLDCQPTTTADQLSIPVKTFDGHIMLVQCSPVLTEGVLCIPVRTVDGKTILVQLSAVVAYDILISGDMDFYNLRKINIDKWSVIGSGGPAMSLAVLPRDVFDSVVRGRDILSVGIFNRVYQNNIDYEFATGIAQYSFNDNIWRSQLNGSYGFAYYSKAIDYDGRIIASGFDFFANLIGYGFDYLCHTCFHFLWPNIGIDINTGGGYTVFSRSNNDRISVFDSCVSEDENAKSAYIAVGNWLRSGITRSGCFDLVYMIKPYIITGHGIHNGKEYSFVVGGVSGLWGAIELSGQVNTVCNHNGKTYIGGHFEHLQLLDNEYSNPAAKPDFTTIDLNYVGELVFEEEPDLDVLFPECGFDPFPANRDRKTVITNVLPVADGLPSACYSITSHKGKLWALCADGVYYYDDIEWSLQSDDIVGLFGDKIKSVNNNIFIAKNRYTPPSEYIGIIYALKGNSWVVMPDIPFIDGVARAINVIRSIAKYPDFKTIVDTYETTYNCVTQEWTDPVLVWQSRKEQETNWTYKSGKTYYKNVIGEVPEVPEEEPEGLCPRSWTAIYNCNGFWELSNVGFFDPFTPETEWLQFPVFPREWQLYRVVWGEEAPEEPGYTPENTDCWYEWVVEYDCDLEEWIMTPSVLKRVITPNLNWVRLSGNIFRKHTATAVEPTPPDISEAACGDLYYWNAIYDCYSGEWDISRSDPAEEGEEVTDWIYNSVNDYYRVWGENEPPPPPEYSCYYYWSAYYDCWSESWDIYLDWIDGSGSASDWNCTDYGYGWCECYKVTTSNVKPDAPDFNCASCDEEW